MGLFYFYDYSYFLFMIPALILSLYAQIRVSSTFNRYSKITNTRRITGAEAAKRVLFNNGVNNVKIEYVRGKLTDHFDPKTKTIKLSDSVYNSTSVAAVGVAAHEAGHAVQHEMGYMPIKIRSTLVPITQFSSKLSIPLVILGLIIPSYKIFAIAGIVLFSISIIFELVTLPVEFDASRRAIQTLDNTEILYGDEIKGAKKVLSAAAMTYLAAMISSVLTLLRLIFILRRND